MNPELISRVVELIGKHGDRVVLADPQTGKAVMVMDLKAYEQLVSGARPEVPAALPPVEPAVKPPVSEDKPAEPPLAVKPAKNLSKKAAVSEISFPAAKPEPISTEASLADLTQEELLDKINREIGAWKTAQESKRTQELQSAAQNIRQFQVSKAFEEEERFYLEPIE